MSKQLLEKVFQMMLSCRAWSLSVLRVKYSKRTGTTYYCREVRLNPPGKLSDFVRSIHDCYCSPDGIERFSSVEEYAGELVNQVVYKLDKKNELIVDQYNNLIQAIGTVDKETPFSEIQSNAMVLKGNVNVDGNDFPVLFFSIHRPVVSLTNKFLWLEGQSFKEISEPVLTLRKTIDVAIIGDTVYLFTQTGENLFNLERSYKKMCRKTVEEIVKCGFLSDIESFSRIANSGRNPRRFVSYNSKRFEWLREKENRENISSTFNILLEDEKINTRDQTSVDKLIRFLCNKAMIDPCNKEPYEVTLPKLWS